MMFWIFFLLGAVVECLQSSTPTPTSPSITNTQWKLKLDVGLQEGTWMPKRFPGWAESGARLGLDVQVEFKDTPSSAGEELVGLKSETFELEVTSGASRFVSERGEQTVEFTRGGWCIQRPTRNIRNAGGSMVKPEGLLRFWLDCPTGATRRDVEIFPGTRIYFTTGVWDDPAAITRQDEEYRKVLEDLQTLADKTRETREQSADQNIFQKLGSFQELVGNAKEFDYLRDLKDRCERELPPAGASVANNGIQMAPTGSLVIKGNENPDWLPSGSEYLILGKFSTSAVET